jgi:4-hydroxy-L-threonine phosphate dehydrogenase PdxA
VRGSGRVFLLPTPGYPPAGTVGELAGVGAELAALQRIEAGSVDEADFACVGDRWDLRERLQQQWQALRLPDDLDPAQPPRASVVARPCRWRCPAPGPAAPIG